MLFDFQQQTGSDTALSSNRQSSLSRGYASLFKTMALEGVSPGERRILKFRVMVMHCGLIFIYINGLFTWCWPCKGAIAEMRIKLTVYFQGQLLRFLNGRALLKCIPI